MNLVKEGEREERGRRRRVEGGGGERKANIQPFWQSRSKSKQMTQQDKKKDFMQPTHP